jgi:hypothetical protein
MEMARGDGIGLGVNQTRAAIWQPGDRNVKIVQTDGRARRLQQARTLPRQVNGEERQIRRRDAANP